MEILNERIIHTEKTESSDNPYKMPETVVMLQLLQPISFQIIFLIMIVIHKQKLVQTQYMHWKVAASQNVNACEAC